MKEVRGAGSIAIVATRKNHFNMTNRRKQMELPKLTVKAHTYRNRNGEGYITQLVVCDVTNGELIDRVLITDSEEVNDAKFMAVVNDCLMRDLGILVNPYTGEVLWLDEERRS
jgi:hypothetical protein